LVTVPGTAKVRGVCVSYAFLSPWEQREKRAGTRLSRKTVLRMFGSQERYAATPTDAHLSGVVDGIEVRGR
jgi:hypothetical protein